MTKKPKTLKEIAIELLEKYEASETTVICEYSTNIRHSVELLGKEVAKYRKMIDKADRKTEPSNSEKPNNCEEWHGDCKTCEWYDGTSCGIPCCDYEPKDEPQKIGYCNECKWFRDKQVCGRCRSKNLYAPKDEPQTDCAWK